MQDNNLDNIIMDKRSSPRASLQSSKGPNLESKYKQDGTSKPFWASRRGDNSSQRQEQPKKANPRKTKTTVDKRPRPRGYVSNIDRDRSEVVDAEGDFPVEEAANKPYPRKANWNHLLNFTYTKDHGGDVRGSQATNYPKSKPTKYNKEQYLQANCQFVVKTGGDYTINLVDPDVLVDWALIEQVLLPSYENPSCPICLYEATAAKMTRCGHIYCWACILHYLSLSERSWHKCPICYEAVHQNDLKSVRVVSRVSLRKGDEICLSLMRRDKNSLFPIPVNMWINSPTDHFKYSKDNGDNAGGFQKLLLAEKSQVLSIINKERLELTSQLDELEDGSEIVFIETALQLLKEREVSISTADCHPESKPTNTNKLEEHDPNKNEICVDSKMTDPLIQREYFGYGDEAMDKAKHDTLDLPQPLDNANANQQSFFFYQASDGQHVYLNSLNARMLIQEFGSLEESPLSINATIVDLENLTMTKALRNRFRYLKHLPLSCQFQIAELSFEPSLISNENLLKFNDEIQKRRRARNRKVREERQRERHIEIEQNKKMGKFPAARYSLNSFQQFPTCNSGSTDEEPFNANHFEPLCNLPDQDQAIATVTKEDLEIESSTSFAQMLRKSKPPECSGIVEKENAMKNAPKNVDAIQDSDDEGPGVPEYRVSFGDAIQEAMNSMALKSKDSSGPEKKGRKKKNKKTVLFSTSMNRSK